MKTTIKTDICILGAGSGGLSLAAGAAQMGASVVLLEQDKMGGDCLNYGCVPSKALLAASKLAHVKSYASELGINYATCEIDFAKVNQHIKNVIAGIEPNDSVERFTQLGVKVILEAGKFVAPRIIETESHRIQARRIVIATGSSPAIPKIEGINDTFFLTNETVFDLTTAPQHLIIIGGGPIGCEMAQAHRRLGCEVTILECFEIMPKDDRKLVDVVRQQLLADGIKIYEYCQIDKVETINDQVVVNIEQQQRESQLTGSHLLVATGRKPNLTDLDLDAAGIIHSIKGINVDQRLRTNNKKVFAIGDVTGMYQFTHMANYHAGIVLKNILFRLPAKTDFRSVPWVTYTDPELAHVGLNEQQAFSLDDNIEILHFDYAENDRARAENLTHGKIKVIADRKGYILGVSIVGQHAGELLMPWILAIQRKLKLNAIAELIVPYPTLSEINKRVAGSFYTNFLFSKKVRRLVKWLSYLG